MDDNYDTEKFISLIKAKESIWNYKSKAYNDKRQRKQDWISVCTDILPDFAEKTSGERSAILLELQAKWKVLRDGFTRSVKNYMQKGRKYKKKAKLYTYYNQLQFLNELYEDQKKIFNDLALSKHKTLEISRKRIRHTAIDVPFEETFIDGDSPPVMPIPKKERIDDGELEDRQFLLSLLGDFRKIPEDRKLDAKGDIINVIRHYRNTPTALLNMRGSYYSKDISALATTATDELDSQGSTFYVNMDNESSGESNLSSDIIKCTIP